MKKVGFIQKYSGKEKMDDEDDNINSKENEEEIEDAKEEINEIPPIMQIDYDELPEGVYDFAGLAELQHRRTKPNPKENEKLLKTKSKKGKRELEKKNKKVNIKNVKEENKNIVEELFVEKKNVELQKEDVPVINEELENNIEELEKNTEEVQKDIIVETVENSDIIEELKQEENKVSELENIEIKKQEQIEPNIQEVSVLEEPKEDEEIKQEEIIEFKEKDHFQITNYFTPNKIFAFCIMLFLGIVTQISFLASNRQNNLFGLGMITLSAISMLFIVNILNIQNKILILILSLIAVFMPVYNDILITGENAIIYNISLVLSLLSLNLIFVKKNKIISFVVAATIFAIGYKICQICMEIFLIVGIIKIIKDIFNRTEKISNFLLHCIAICVILSIGIFL